MVESRLPLAGRNAVVTGVSRRRGIGFAVTVQLLEMGADLFVHSYREHDESQPWGADPLEEVLSELRQWASERSRLTHADLDLREANGADTLIRTANEALGHLDILVCNHALSGSDGDLMHMTADQLDAHWQVNARSTLMATRHFAAQHDGREGGRVIWMTSGQNLGPMPNELAYATSKAALAGITASVADQLIDRNIVLNTVNPGPVDTGYLAVEPELSASVLSRFPNGQLGQPTDPARLIGWLASDDGRWVVGQVLNSEGGFRRG